MNLLPPTLPLVDPRHRPLTAVADVSTLDWNDFRFFLAVARAGTVSAAARALQIDQATVGRKVAALEAALGLQLFERSPLGYLILPRFCGHGGYVAQRCSACSGVRYPRAEWRR
ncbi:helix-turn-helix domain-containing protein, partial [Methylobacterium nigriterrae]|uniref:helix-turn-helix domain-containing protein n=1 Tax=Methylobacterium nigriterrae TaxID=3127512 RepID=UPI003013492A